MAEIKGGKAPWTSIAKSDHDRLRDVLLPMEGIGAHKYTRYAQTIFRTNNPSQALFTGHSTLHMKSTAA